MCRRNDAKHHRRDAPMDQAPRRLLSTTTWTRVPLPERGGTIRPEGEQNSCTALAQQRLLRVSGLSRIPSEKSKLPYMLRWDLDGRATSGWGLVPLPSAARSKKNSL